MVQERRAPARRAGAQRSLEGSARLFVFGRLNHGSSGPLFPRSGEALPDDKATNGVDFVGSMRAMRVLRVSSVLNRNLRWSRPMACHARGVSFFEQTSLLIGTSEGTHDMTPNTRFFFFE